VKLIIAIVNNDDSAIVSASLTTAGYYTTKLSTTGGFLQTGNTTLLIGADDTEVDNVISVIKEHSSTRVKEVPTNASFGRGISAADVKAKAHVSGATIFVLSVDAFEKL
jgi:uncharacterized protein YaaQ